MALTELAQVMGFQTVVIDPRSAFGNSVRFPSVDRLIQAWPDEAFRKIRVTGSTAIAMLTHDPKLDDPALRIALPSQAFYVGALGSKTTQARRRQRLLDAGLSEAQVERLHGPIGLDIQARTPEEIALSILAEIVAAWEAAQRSDKLNSKEKSGLGKPGDGHDSIDPLLSDRYREGQVDGGYRLGGRSTRA